MNEHLEQTMMIQPLRKELVMGRLARQSTTRWIHVADLQFGQLPGTRHSVSRNISVVRER
ncbi:MAG TPA: hypothetical protein DIT01_10740 [Lentisphaeria bacterium]|nr:hypothetical protein [Lentisphaeria bacterium]